jgi:meromycolic acid enoyl-[acyl-carrier protein] reductase
VLSGRRLLVTGVVTRNSIAFEAARLAQLAGAEVVLSGFGRARRLTERAAQQLPSPADVLELDVNSDTDIGAVARELEERWGVLDGLVHAVAFAPGDALGGDFLGASRASANVAFQTSAFSLKALARELAPLLARGHDGAGGAIVGLDFDATVAWPVYDWMGVAKAALESVARYLARDLGPQGIRVNLVSAGPIQTLAAGAIPGFEELAANWRSVAPLQWDVADAGPVGDAICFLLSERARGITAEIVHVDGGYHAMGAPIRQGEAPAAGALAG